MPFLPISLTTYDFILKSAGKIHPTMTKKKRNVERNWVSDLMLLQIENIPAGHNEVTLMYKHLAQKNNPAVTPQPTKLPFARLPCYPNQSLLTAPRLATISSRVNVL